MPNLDYVISAPADCIITSIPQLIASRETRIPTKGRQALNITDGGFLAAKLICEFGIIGLLLVLAYLVLALKSVVKINHLNNQNIIGSDSYKKQIFMYGIVVAYFTEIMLRGYGYFSPGLFFLLTAIFYIKHNSIKNV